MNIEVTFRVKLKDGQILQQKMFLSLEEITRLNMRRSYPIEAQFHSFVNDIILMGALDESAR